MHTRQVFLTVLAGLAAWALIAQPVFAQEAPAHPLFAADAPLQLRLTAPIRQLKRDDADERPERPATLEWTDPGGTEHTFDVDVRVRGISRLAHCAFPPLRLDFSREQVQGTVFDGQNKLKLVTLCEPTSKYRDYLSLEFDIYRLLNLLTERSFRVRWASIEYLDSDRDFESTTAPAFFIESEEEVAERSGLENVEQSRLTVTAQDAAHLALVAVFQYLIGNTDWSVQRAPDGEACCHNGKVMRGPDGSLLVIPYDFDSAGLINAEYAVPGDNLPILRVTQRLYRGFCELNSELPAAVDLLNVNRAAMEAVLADERLGRRARGRAVDFLLDSFAELNDPKTMQKRLVEKCR